MLLLSEFYLHRFRLQVFLPMDTHTSSRRALKLAQEQEVAEDQRQPRNERQSSTCCRDFGTKERESEGREVVLDIHPCGILLLPQARPKMPCIYTSLEV